MEHDHLFQFDPLEPSAEHASPRMELPLSSVHSYRHMPTLSLLFAEHSSAVCDMSSPHDMPTGSSAPAPDRKGKAVAIPSPAPDADDIFSMSPVEPGMPSDHLCASPSAFDFFSLPSSTSYPDEDCSEPTSGTGLASSPIAVGKGKARAEPPVLPPLAFTPMEVGYGRIEWPSPCSASTIAGPSSFGSTYSPAPATVTPMNVTSTPSTPTEFVYPTHPPVRRRSLSNLSIHSTRSLAGLSMSKFKVKLGAKKSSNLAKKLLFRKSRDMESPTRPSSPPITAVDVPAAVDPDAITIEVGHGGGCFAPWRGDVKLLSSPTIDLASALCETRPIYMSSRDAATLKGKGRSYSSPFPLPTHAFDVVPVPPQEISAPVPVIKHNHFEELLPRELQLHVFCLLVECQERAHAILVGTDAWTVLKAGSSKNKYVGRDRGVRELVKLSRVSKHWQSLAFDGQLWTNMDLRSFPRVPTSMIMRVAQMAGSFVTRVDVSGHAHLSPSTVVNMVDHLSLQPTRPSDVVHTQLTHINLFGCSSLNTRSLQHLLEHSHALQALCVKGLAAVTDSICELLASSCPDLRSLDLGRCPFVSGAGIRRMSETAMIHGARLQLRELRLSGINFMDDNVMDALGRAAPYLEVLDLSYARHLHSSALAAFVACTDDMAQQVDSVLLTSREAGRDPTDSRRYRRRVTRLRHLNLTSCMWLTDVGCSNLAHAVPNLEFLELAGLGGDLRDEGLIHLLRTTPQLRRLDLEDAVNISDSVLEALTPFEDIPSRRPAAPTVKLGEKLEHLVISYAGNITDGALFDLIRNCTKLRVLEADNTPMSRAAMKEFVRLVRERQTRNARLVAVDCRNVGERDVKDLAAVTRPRLGWRAFEAKKLGFLDARDEEALGVGQDECDERRVVLKTFYSWQTVDAVKAAREKQRRAKGRRVVNGSETSPEDDFAVGREGQRARWWTPGGRRSGSTSPTLLDLNDREGCTIM